MNYYQYRAFLLSLTKNCPKWAKEQEQYEMAAARKRHAANN